MNNKIRWTEDERRIVESAVIERQEEYPEERMTASIYHAQSALTADRRRPKTSLMADTSMKRRMFEAVKEARRKTIILPEVAPPPALTLESFSTEELVIEMVRRISPLVAQWSSSAARPAYMGAQHVATPFMVKPAPKNTPSFRVYVVGLLPAQGSALLNRLRDLPLDIVLLDKERNPEIPTTRAILGVVQRHSSHKWWETLKPACDHLAFSHGGLTQTESIIREWWERAKKVQPGGPSQAARSEP